MIVTSGNCVSDVFVYTRIEELIYYHLNVYTSCFYRYRVCLTTRGELEDSVTEKNKTDNKRYTSLRSKENIVGSCIPSNKFK